MEIERNVISSTSKKRKNNIAKTDESPISKKTKLFSVKEFRKKLNTDEKLGALQEFHKILDENSNDYAFDYLDNGGNILELLQILESDSTIPPYLVFNIITKLLLRISTGYGQFHNASYEACRYLINNYLPVVHKMIGLSSSKEERRSCLKLLTALVTFSPNLAKDILLNVKLHTSNIELLTKHTGEKDNVRDSFIHFLTAFLIDSDYHTLQIVLQRSYLFTSIIAGLQYDIADTTCIVITAMKNYILQNPSVTKTTKMHVFNTLVVRDIVNLYNWKGPEGFKLLKNDKTVVEVDKVAKSKVSECVHDLLLELCTNHKNGVIFKDPQIGLGRRNQNSLMYTVLNSLDRPWEHSYASELVIKICQSCPDLTKNMWTILKPFLEPRLTDKWFKAVSFIKKLLKVLQPTCIEYCASNLSPYQLAQIIEILVSPAPIIKILFPEDESLESLELKQHIYGVILEMLNMIDIYLQATKEWTSADNCKKIKNILSNFIAKNYPSAQMLFSDWSKVNLEVNPTMKVDFLKVVLDVLKFYQNLAPQLLYDITSDNLNINDFFAGLSGDEKSELLLTKVIDIFIDIDQSYFAPESELFSAAISLLLKTYHKHRTEEIGNVLRKILKSTDIFESCLYEIDTWSNGIFNFNSIPDSFLECFSHILKDVTMNLLSYQKEFSDIDFRDNFNETFLNILEDDDDTCYSIKHKHFSLLTLGFLHYIQRNEASKTVKKYLEFILLNIYHSQTVPARYFAVVQMYRSVIPSHVLEYLTSWSTNNGESIRKMKGSLQIFTKFSEDFLNNIIKEEYFIEKLYPCFFVDLLRISTFYYSNLIKNDSITENHSRNWYVCIEELNKRELFDMGCVEIILGNPVLVNNFDIKQVTKETASGICTRSIYKVVQMILSLPFAEKYTRIYAQKVFNSIRKGLKKPNKIFLGEGVEDYLKVFPLSYEFCKTLINQVLENTDHRDPKIITILSYTISRIAALCKSQPDFGPLDENVIFNISLYMINKLKLDNDCSCLSRSLIDYFAVFPYSIKNIDDKLFPTLLKTKEYYSDNADLMVFLLERNLIFTKCIEENITNAVNKKGIILPITHVLVNTKASEGTLKLIYENLEGALVKALQKPQKVGQHFLKDYDIAVLIETFMSQEKCKSFIDKVQKFDVTELFHVRYLEAVHNKVFREFEISEKRIYNIILTYIHLLLVLFKKKSLSENNDPKLAEVTIIFNRILEKIISKQLSVNLKSVSSNEAFKSFCKFALKFGVSGQNILLSALRLCLSILKTNMEQEDAALLLEMLLSHSEFLNVVLGEHSDTKLEILKLLLVLSENWPDLMQKSHVAIALSAYRGLVTRCDRIILKLLKLYELKASKTNFYDFKPFLWGRAAVTHYSVRTQIESSLTRQPKISNVLAILKEDIVNNTIINYPLKENLNEEQADVVDIRCYDLKFLLPLFSHLLAPEQQVKTYIFTRSGALSLTIIGLSSTDNEVRQAACHVLSRFYFHLEARQTGKDNPLWIRFVEALCRGTAVLPNFKLNNFSAIFFAKMSLILTNPKHSMFAPLSSYLTAKQDLDLSTIPELYTLFFSSEVNFREHRTFILEILRDGLRTEKDFLDFLKSMGLKLFSELFSSCLVDIQGKVLILEVLLSACKIPLGVNMLCENFALLSQLYNIIYDHLSDKKGVNVISKIISIFLEIVNIKQDEYTSKFVFYLFMDISRSDKFLYFKDLDIKAFYEVIYKVYKHFPGVVECKKTVLDALLSKSDDSFSRYLQKYGCDYINEKVSDFQIKDKYVFLRMLVFDILK